MGAGKVAGKKQMEGRGGEGGWGVGRHLPPPGSGPLSVSEQVTLLLVSVWVKFGLDEL